MRRISAAFVAATVVTTTLVGSAPAQAEAVSTTITRDGISVLFQHLDAGPPGPAGTRSRYDLDGDGRDELIVRGYQGNLGAKATVAVRFSRTGVLERIQQENNNFTASAVGDFDGDGFGDLALGDSRANAAASSAGSVWIFYGTATGFAMDRTAHFNAASPGIGGTVANPSGFAYTLVTGDVNQDGRDDLAIGAPYQEVNGITYAGAVVLLYGSATGLTGTGAATITQDSPGVPGVPVSVAMFGQSLAIADVTHDGHPDLVVGAPHDGWGGTVMVVPGTGTGFGGPGAVRVEGLDFGNLIVMLSSLGSSVAVADVNGDGYADIIAGAPDSLVNGRNQAGALIALYGGPSGISASRSTVLHQETRGVPGVADAVDSLGWSLATGDVTGDGIADVVTGIVYDKIGSAAYAGSLLLLRGSATGLSGSNTALFNQDSAGVPGIVGYQHMFGGQITVLDLDGVGALDVLAAAPSENLIAKFSGGGGTITATGSVDLTVLIPNSTWPGLPLRSAVGSTSGRSVTPGKLAALSDDVRRTAAMTGSGHPSATQVRSLRTSGVFQESAAAPAVPATAPAVAATAPTARFDLDGDGIDEIVATHNPHLLVRYSRLGRTDFLTTPYWSGVLGEGAAAADFNQDGFTDLAIGDYSETVPGHTDQTNAGSIWVCNGSAEGLLYETCLHLSQDSPGMPDRAETQDLFGRTLAAGDLNGDGYPDLAISAEGESFTTTPSRRVPSEPGRGNQYDGSGAVTVIYGSPSGLTTAGASHLSYGLSHNRLTPHSSRWDEFGKRLAIGDVTGDGVADLAIGAHGLNGGTIYLVKGSTSRLGPAGMSVVSGRDLLPTGTIYCCNLGYGLKIADTDGDGRAEVIAGFTGLPVNGWSSAGGVVEYRGLPEGISRTAYRVITQETPGVPGAAQQNSWFGNSLATGDVTGDGIADVLVGSACAEVAGKFCAGQVFLLPGSPAGLTGTGSQLISQETPGVPGEPEETDMFGLAVSILNLDGTGGLDAVVGVPSDGNGNGLIQLLLSSGGGLIAGQAWSSGDVAITNSNAASMGWSILND